MNSLPSPNRSCHQRSVLLVVGFVVFISVMGFGSVSNVYIAQSAAGGNTGADCADAYAASFFNTPSNWGSGSNQIGPGTVVHLCGTFSVAASTNVLTFHGSGTSGNVIELRWESGATMTSPAWGTNGNAAVNLNHNTYVLINGNCAGVGYRSGGTPCATPSITSTANGSGLAYAQDAHGVSAGGGYPCNHCEFKNLTITNMYVHNSVSDNTCGCGEAISMLGGGSELYVHDNYLDQEFIGLDDAYGSDTDVEFYNNTVDHFNWGTHIGGNNTATLTTVLAHDNHLKNANNWDTTADSFHHDGIFIVNNNTGANLTDINIYNNFADGDGSDCSSNSCMTAWIFVNTGIHGINIFNNVLLHTAGTAQVMMEGGYTGDSNYALYNNFIDCGGASGGLGFGIGPVNNFTLENNTINNCSTYFSTRVTGTATVDHNVYAAIPGGTNTFEWNGSFTNYAGYRSANPTLDADSLTPASDGATSLGVPQSGSAMIHNGTTNFLNLTSLCSGSLVALCTDFAGVAQPSTGTDNWDAGAYQYGSGDPPPSPPTGLAVVVH